MIKNRPFLIREAPDAPPGAPKASWTAYTAADCTLPPRDPGEHLEGISPGPRPRGDYFYILFSTSFSLPPSF